MRKSFAFNRIISFLLVMVMVIIMVPTHFFPKAAEEAPSTVSDRFIRSGDVSVQGKLPRGTILKAKTVDNPFALKPEEFRVASLKGASFVNGIKGVSPSTDINDSEHVEKTDEVDFSKLNYLGFYDISLSKGGAEVQPDGSATVTIRNLNLTYVSNVKVIHILDSENAIVSAIKSGKAKWVRDSKFVSAFSQEAQMAYNVVKEENVVIIEMLDATIVNKNSISFTTNSFSVYAVVEQDDINHATRVKYQFLNSDGTEFMFLNTAGNYVSYQIIKNNESLEYVGAPEISASNQKFNGWYIYTKSDDSYTLTAYEVKFGTPISVEGSAALTSVTSNRVTVADEDNASIADKTQPDYTVYVMPYYGDVHYINFYNTADGTIVFNKVQVPADTEYNISEQEAIPPDAIITYDDDGNIIDIKYVSYAFTGWSRSIGTLEEVGNPDSRVELSGDDLTVVVSEDLNFYPIFRLAHWVSFFTAPTGTGATYYPPVYVLTSEDVSKAEPSTPEWKGHRFIGWFETPDDDYFSLGESDTDAFSFSGYLDSDIILYAHWDAGTANYTVIYWEQLVTDSKTATDNDKHYEYAGQENFVGQVTSTVYASSYQKEHFVINSKKSDKSVVILDDGTAVLNIYYDRELMYMVFTGNSSVPGYTNNNSYYTVANDENGTQYGYVEGQYVQLTRSSSTQIIWYFRYVYTAADRGDFRIYEQTRTYTSRNNVSSGQRYRRDNGNLTNNRYTGTRYTRSGNNYTNYTYTITTGTSGAQFGLDGNGCYVELSNQSQTTYNWSYQSDGEIVEYIGTRYKVQNVSAAVYTGLYGQTLSQNSYSWPNGAWWYDEPGSSSSTGMSYLGEFKFPIDGNTIVFESSGTTNRTIYFYLQNEDGSWPTNANDSGYVNAVSTWWGGTSSFGFTEKYEGFTVDSYHLNDNGNNGNSGAWISTAVNDSVALSSNLGVKYRRKTYFLKFIDSRDNTVISTINGVDTSDGITLSFGSVIGNNNSISRIISAETLDSGSVEYVWDGKWYSDSACTTEFDFNQAMTNHDMAVYVKWNQLWYWVKIDPDGGELTATEATWFWETRGQFVEEYHDVARVYIKDPEGEYVYHYDEFDPETETNKNQNHFLVNPSTGEYLLDSKGNKINASDRIRRAMYIKIGESVTVENVSVTLNEAQVVDGVEKIVPVTYTGNVIIEADPNGERYSPDSRAYSLVGWYLVDPDTDEAVSVFNFTTEVSRNLTLRAIWRTLGDYRVVYSAEGVDASGNKLYYDNGDPVVAFDVPPVDNNRYADKSNSSIGSALNGIPEGYTFTGWLYGEKIYNPGDSFMIMAERAVNKIITLKPVFTKIEQLPVESTQIVWHGNGGTTNLTSDEENNFIVEDENTIIQTSDLIINATFGLTDTEEYFSRPGYIFKGWAKTANATTPWIAYVDSDTDDGYYMSDKKIEYVAADNNDKIVDDDGSIHYNNDLYAVWEKKLYTIKVVKAIDSPLTVYDKQTIFTFTPSGLTGDNQVNFSLTAEETTIVNEDNGSSVTYLPYKLLQNVQYGTVFNITEGDNPNFELVKISTSVTNSDIAELNVRKNYEDPSTFPSSFTVDGDIEITFTNLRQTVNVDVEKTVISDVTSDDNAKYTFTVSYVDGENTVSDIIDYQNGSSSGAVTVPKGIEVTVEETAVPGMETKGKAIIGNDENEEVDGTTVRFEARDDSVVAFTNTRPSKTLKIIKNTQDEAGGTFEIHIVETSGNKVDHKVDVTSDLAEGATAATVTLPAGTTFTINEVLTTTQAGLYMPDPVIEITSDDGAIAENNCVYTILEDGEITITNNRKPVEVTVVKTVVSNLKSDYKAYSFDYYIDGATEKSGDLTVTVTLPEGETTHTATSATVINVPYGKTVKIVETTADPYITVESNIDGKAGDETLTSNALTDPAYTATFTNTRPNYTVTVSKVTDDIGTINDSFKMVLTKLAETVIGDTTIEDYVKLGTGAKNATFTLPAGMTFKFAEELTDAQKPLYNYAEGQPLYEVGGGVSKEGNTYTITDNGTIIVTNYRKPIKVKITKTVISPVKADFSTYKFKYFIGNSTEGLNAPDAVVTWPTDGSNTASVTVEFMVPYGSTVRVEEQDIDTNAITVESSFGTKAGNVTIELGQLTALENVVEYTNTRNMVDVKVKKVVENFNGTAVFPFSASWTIGTQTDEPVAVTNDANKLANNAEWSFKVPYGANVKVKETGSANVKINDVDYAISKAFTTVNDAGTSSDEGRTGVTAALTDKEHAKVITFTNTRKNVQVKLVKILDNKGVTDAWSSYAFPIKYQVVDGTATAETAQWIIPEYETGKYGVPAGEAGVTVTVPFGAIVNVDEDTTAKPAGINHTIAETFKVTYAPAEKTAVAANTDNATVFTVTNVRNTVKVKLVKNVLSDDSSDFDGTTPYNFNVTTAVQALNGKHTIIIGESKTGYVEIEIPYGTDISFEETGIDAQKFDTFVAIDNNEARKELTSVLTDVIDEHTVTYTNRKILTVTVNKIVVSGLAADFTSYPFAISYYDIDGKLTRNVVVPGSNGQNRSVSVSATGVAGETPITFPVPYGTTKLSVAEVLGNAAGSFTTALTIVGATGTAGANNQSATVATVNVDTTITFTNTRKMQTITVEKTVDSLLAADLKAYTFTYGYKYYAVSGEQTVANATVDVTVSSSANPATATFQIPYDAHDFEISEPDNSGTTTVLTTVTGTGSLANGTASESDANRKYAGTANITADGKVSFTNKRVVYVLIEKILDSLDSGRAFTFSYTYENPADANDSAHKGSSRVTVTVDNNTMTGDSTVIEIPYGAKVTVTETTTEGYSTYVLVPYGSASQDTAISGSATITSGTEAKPAKFAFTNHRVVPLKVTKVVDSEEPSDKVKRDYDFTVTYNYTGATGNGTTAFTITVDEMLFGDNTIYVPFGAKNVVITETPVNGYDTVAVSKTEGVTGTNTGSEYVKNVFTITGPLEKAATVEYTNIRMVDVTVIKELDSEEDVTSFDYNYTYTGKNHNTTKPVEFDVTISANKQGTKVLHVPYGVTLTINELLSETEVSNKYYDTFWGVGTVGSTINAGNKGTTASNVGPVTGNTTAVKFSNKRMVNVKIIKNVDDPTLSTENNKYTFTYTYTYNNTPNTPDPVVITVDTTSATGNTGYFRIPYNAANFVVTETIDLRVFDVDADSTGTAGTLNGAAYTLSQNVTAVNTDITFNNQRMVEVEVVKKVESSEQADKNANYSVTYGYTRIKTGNIAAAVNVTGQTGTIKDATDGNLTVRMPYGSTFTVTETGDLSKFQVLYSTTDNTALTEGKEVTLENVTAAKTVTFTNRKLYTVTVRKHVDNTVNDIPVTDRLDSAAFDFTYIVGGTVGYNTASDGDGFSLTNYVADATPVAEKVITLPYGASFVLEEIDTANFSGTGYKMSDLFTVKYADAQGNLGDDGFSIGRVIADTVANVYNTRNTREITVEKTLDSQVAADFHAYTFNWAVANWTSGAVTLTPVTQNVAVSDKVIVPVGLQVTVTEDNTKPSASAFVGMDTTVKVGNGEAAEAYTGTVPAGLENVTVYFVNTRVTADLTITKTIKGDISKHVPALEGRTFMFRITANENGYTYDHIVMIKGAGSVTISQLQTGYNYTVTEITGWSYEFDASGAYYAPVSAPANITNGTNDYTVTFLFVENGVAVFSNEANDTNWLRGEAYADNRFYPNQK